MRIVAVALILLPLVTVAQKKNCLLQKETFYNGQEVDYQLINTFDEKSNLINKKESFGKNLFGPYQTEKKFQYDLKGNNTTIEIYQNNVLRSVTNKTYNSQNALMSEDFVNKVNNVVAEKVNITKTGTERVFYDKNGSVSSTITEVLNEQGKLLSKTVKDSKGFVSATEENVFSANGILQKKTSVDVVGKLTKTTLYSYDLIGNLEKETYQINDKAGGSMEQKYDVNKNLIQKSLLDANAKLQYQYRYEYDAQNKIVKEIYLYENQPINTDVFEYDADGNKIKQSSYNQNNQLIKYKTWEYTCK